MKITAPSAFTLSIVAVIAACSVSSRLYGWDVQVEGDKVIAGPDGGPPPVVCSVPGSGMKFPQTQRVTLDLAVVAANSADSCSWAQAHARLVLGLSHVQCDPHEAIPYTNRMNDDERVFCSDLSADKNWIVNNLGGLGMVNWPACAPTFPLGVSNPFNLTYNDYVVDGSVFGEAGVSEWDDAGAEVVAVGPPECDPASVDAGACGDITWPETSLTACIGCFSEFCCTTYQSALANAQAADKADPTKSGAFYAQLFSDALAWGAAGTSSASSYPQPGQPFLPPTSSFDACMTTHCIGYQPGDGTTCVHP